MSLFAFTKEAKCGLPTSSSPSTTSFRLMGGRPSTDCHAWTARSCMIEGGDHLHEGTPKIELGCKGILYLEMTSRTAKVDQHSSYAAIAPNPAWRLIHALMTLRDAKGRIKVPGWYKDARRPTARELR